MGNAWARLSAAIGTSSRCVTDTAVHNFTVTSYSLLNGMGKFVESDRFTVGGSEWNIRFYPDGDRQWQEGESRCAGVFVCRCTGAGEARAKFSLSLLGKDGRTIIRRPESTLTTFEPPGGRRCWGSPKFVQKSVLRDDCFTIRCQLTVVQDPDVVGPVMVPLPPSNIHQQFANMLKDGEGVYVSVSVGDRSFRAHKDLLAAQSPVFMDLLHGETNEHATHERVKIEGIEPHIFEAFLNFIYNDSLPDDWDVDENTKVQLLVAAGRYQLDRLRAMCEERLCRGIDIQTVADTIALAEQHSCVHLRRACLEFLVPRRDVLEAVMETDGFERLKASHPFTVIQIFEKAASLGA